MNTQTRWGGLVGVVRLALCWMLGCGGGVGVCVAADVLRHGAAATVHSLASVAARETVAEGGNAVDGAIAAALMLGVVDGHNSGLGGGCFLLIRTPEGKVVAVDGRETAPQRAHRDLYVRQGKAVPELSQHGALAVATPGALAAYAYASQQYGRRPLQQLLNRAARRASEGFPLSGSYVDRIRSTSKQIAQFPEAASLLLDERQQPWTPGTLLIQRDLAETYRKLAEEGPGWFYEGPFARRTEEWMNAHGGILGAADFRQYRIRLREPVRTGYRGYEVVGFPPPSSGGTHVAEILNILEQFPMQRWKRTSPEFVHLVAEAMKLAFADRAHWMGDPDFTKVPRGLLDKSYARERAGRIKMEAVLEGVRHGTPKDADRDYFEKHTTHFTVVDEEGWWVACTATINTSFGSKVIIPGTGLFLNNEMDDFSTAPGVANFFGLVGGEANAVAPGKRPLSSMSPTLVLKDGQPVMTVGAAGGPTIISQVVLAVLGVLDQGLSLEEALKAPRFHHQWSPDELLMEDTMPAETVATLKR